MQSERRIPPSQLRVETQLMHQLQMRNGPHKLQQNPMPAPRLRGHSRIRMLHGMHGRMPHLIRQINQAERVMERG